MKTVNSTPYTHDQVMAIAEQQIGKHSLATRLAYEAGVKACEIASLRPPLVRTVDLTSRYDHQLFSGRKDIVIYTIENRDGISRQIAVSESLAQDLEAVRLRCPVTVEEGGWRRLCGYDIGHGHAWVHNFAEASDIALGFSYGTQGLRHAYIRERMQELSDLGFSPEDRVAVIAIETGLKPGSIERYIKLGRSSPARHVA